MRSLPKLIKLEDEPLWVEVNSLVEYVYSKLSELPEEEKWDTTSRLRGAANTLLFAMAEALGDATSAAAEFNWGVIRRHASALKTMYRFAGRQKFFEIEPEIMVRLDELLQQIDKQITLIYQQKSDDERGGLDYLKKNYILREDKNNES